jgi:hypothetical protein
MPEMAPSTLVDMYCGSGDSQLSSDVDTLHHDTTQEAAFLVLLAIDLL